MNTNPRKPTPSFWYSSVAIISLFGLALGACAPTAAPTAPPPTAAPPTEAPTEIPTQQPPTATPIPPTATPVLVTLTDIAEEIAEEVGEVTTVVETDSEEVIFVFEERHDSRLGQVEIAMMLNRLYADYELRRIGLEGLMADEGPLDLSWAHREPYYQPSQPITGREDVMAQTLQDGEIGSAELLGLVYHDVVVEGIDDAELYAFDPPETAWDAPNLYLYNIALAGMSDTDRTAWNALYEQEQYEDAFEYAVGTDEFSAEMWARLSDQVDIVSAEEWLIVLDDLRAQAEAVETDLTAEDEANLAALDEYFEHVSQRSDVLAANVLALAAIHPEAPVAMTIGALHTERVVELLTEAGVSFVVLRPLSLAEGDTSGLLSAAAYERKRQGLSVAPDGYLGALLDGRGKKPKPTAEEEWYQFSTELMGILQMFAWRNAHGLPVEDVRLEGDQWEGIDVEIVNVIPGDENNPNPIVEWQVRKRWVERDGRDATSEAVRKIVSNMFGEDAILESGRHEDMILLRGTAQLIEGQEEKMDVTVFGRLSQAREELQQEGTTTPETEPRSQRGCSNTTVTVTKAGG